MGAPVTAGLLPRQGGESEWKKVRAVKGPFSIFFTAYYFETDS